MILTCPACQTRYQADAAKFPPEGRNVRCAKCGEVWHEPAPEPESVEAVAEPVPPPQPVEAPRPQWYAQPSADGFGPREEESQAVEPQPPAPTAWPRRIALGAGWMALIGVVLVIAVAVSLYPHEIVKLWPRSASLYSRLGMKVTASGLNIHDIKSSQQWQDGQIILTVSGALTNVSNREQPVPQVRVALVDADKRELYHWTIAPDAMTLRPGQSTHFVTRLSSPPEGAHDVVARFAKAGE